MLMPEGQATGAADSIPDAGFWDSFSLAESKDQLERSWVEKAMKAAGGNVSLAARFLSIKHQLLFYLLDKYKLRRLQRLGRGRSFIKQAEAKTKGRGILMNMFETFELTAPQGAMPGDVFITCEVTSRALVDSGIEPGDAIVVKLGPVTPGRPACLTLPGELKLIGYITEFGNEIRVEVKNGE
jgi:hypothetical protein